MNINCSPSYPFNINEIKKIQPSPVNYQLHQLRQFFSFLQNINKQRLQNSLKELVNKCNEEGVEYLLKITKLDLSHCELDTLPEEVGALTHLQELSLINNNLSQLPDSIDALQNLRKVELEMNQFKKIPEVIHRLALQKIQKKKFFELYLRDNPMKNVSPDIQSIVRSMPRFNSF